MAKNNRCGCSSRRNSNNGYGCLSCVGGRYRWENYPYYTGPCPDADGGYECDCECECDRDDGDREERRCRGRRRRRDRGCFGLFTAMLPMAIAANGIVPLVGGNCLSAEGFNVNCGLITVEEAGTYLATYTVRLPAEAAVESTFSLNVNDAAQASAIVEAGGTGPASYTGQAMFEVCDRATVVLRSSDAINITSPSTQPLVTLSMVKL